METTLEQRNEHRKAIGMFAEALMGQEGAELGDNERCPLTHTFTDGIYSRQIVMPAGFVCVGKIHKHDHPNVLLKGKVTVVTESGGREEIEGPRFMISPAGTQRAVYVHEEATWITFHSNPHNEHDLERIEEFIIAKSYDELESIDIKELP